jgi:hypothetical protein
MCITTGIPTNQVGLRVPCPEYNGTPVRPCFCAALQYSDSQFWRETCKWWSEAVPVCCMERCEYCLHDHYTRKTMIQITARLKSNTPCPEPTPPLSRNESTLTTAFPRLHSVVSARRCCWRSNPMGGAISPQKFAWSVTSIGRGRCDAAERCWNGTSATLAALWVRIQKAFLHAAYKLLTPLLLDHLGLVKHQSLWRCVDNCGTHHTGDAASWSWMRRTKEAFL